MFALVLVGLLSTLWEFGPLVGAGVLAVVTGWTRSVRLGMATAAFTVAALVTYQPFPAVVALAGALLIAAHDVHARRPGEWFPLLAIGSGVLLAFFGEEWVAFRPVWDDTDTDVTFYADLSASTAVAIGSTGSDWALSVVVAVVVATGFAVWAWRTRSLVVLATAAGYLAAAWYAEPAVSGPGMQFLSQEQFMVAFASADAVYRPEVVVLAGAAVAYGLAHGWRDWVPLAVVGPLSTLWEYGGAAGTAVLLVTAWRLRSGRLAGAAVAFAVADFVGAQPVPAVVALAGALVIMAYDLHARRPGVWFALFGVGTGLFLVAAQWHATAQSESFGWFAYAPVTSTHMLWTEGSVGGLPPSWTAVDPLLVFHPAALVLAGAAVALVLRDRRTRTP
ncbi:MULTISPECIES: hypothetical protein [unclassified Saccharothrix]|uniref:hypothetical protein n=1 Tax=unclassified Saccharothrix TaxID=2593673 RepID=UPI00307D230F